MTYTFELFGKSYSGETLADVSALFSAARDESGLGSSTMPLPAIKQDEQIVGHFSYNGRIWDKPSRLYSGFEMASPIYDNRAA
jgi:hypothetical protein